MNLSAQHDFPSYGDLSGCATKGYKACPVCSEKTYSNWLKHSRKVCYTGHRRFLPSKHRFRHQMKAFNGQQEFAEAPNPLSGEEILYKVCDMHNTFGKKNKKKRVVSMKLSKLKKTKKNQVEDRVDTVRKRKRSAGSNLNKIKIARVKQHVEAFQKKYVFFELEYWKYLLVRHMLDVMHIEKNVSESIIGTILDVAGKSKDGLNSLSDLKDMGIKEELQPRDLENGTYLPPACFKLSKEEKIKFCTTLSQLKVPSGYSSSLRNFVSMDDLKLQGLKSHDFHVLMQQLLPVAILSVLPKKVRYVIIRLCFFFKALCSKEVDVSKLDDMQKQLVETLCLLEKYFPPSLFDIMIHLTVHLVREVRLCGPVYFRWMYPFERFLKFLKSNIRNKNRPGGCIAENYTAYEGVEHCAEKFPGTQSTGIPLTGNLVTEGKPFPCGVPVRVDYELWAQAHCTVLANTDETTHLVIKE